MGVHTKYCLYSKVMAVNGLGVYSELAQYQESSMPARDPDTTWRCRVVSECSHAMNECNATGRLRVHRSAHPLPPTWWPSATDFRETISGFLAYSHLTVFYFANYFVHEVLLTSEKGLQRAKTRRRLFSPDIKMQEVHMVAISSIKPLLSNTRYILSLLHKL